jgi:predicted signal transduction protein with EAL and GGDEF domain
VRQADFAMYMAKSKGKARYQVFDAPMHDSMLARSALKTDLAGAVASGQLRVDYQPVVDLRTGGILGLEALVRWQHPTLGLLAPASFISLAEETGNIDAIGCWVLETATRQVAGWRQRMDHCKDLWVAVNLSAFQLPNPTAWRQSNASWPTPPPRPTRSFLKSPKRPWRSTFMAGSPRSTR